MTERRRELLDTSDAPPDLSPDLRFLASRQASLAALFTDHAQRYLTMYRAIRETGATADTRAQALEAAGDLATLLQSLRGREDLQVALAHAPGHVPTPLLAVDQLFFSFALLAGATESASEALDAALTPEGVDELIRSQRVREWLPGLVRTAPEQ